MTDNKRYQAKIKKIAEVFQEVNPEKIILFGSAAHNTIHADSDIDVCVVARTDNPLKTKRQLRNAMWDHNIGFTPEVDIHVYSPPVYSDYKKRHDPFIEEIEKGAVLYER